MSNMRKKIVVSQPMELLPDQIERLKNMGELKIYSDMASSYEEWLERVKDVDIIITGKYGLKQKIYELSDKFIAVPFVAIGWIDKKKLKERNITFAYAPGCNKVAVSEWIIGIMISLLREFPKYINSTNLPKGFPPKTRSLAGKTVCILGPGNVGSRVGKICEALEMNVKYFRRGDDLIEAVKDADVVVNTLSHNPSTEGLLDKKFFSSLKKGAYFITPVSKRINAVDVMIEALDKGTLAGVGTDAGSVEPGDTADEDYKKLLKHPNIIVTPHIAFNTDNTARVGYDMVIDNVEAWLKGKPKNLVE
jgi:glycerate dehydrogenase